MSIKDKVDAKNAKIDADNKNGKAGISGQLQTRIENIEKFLGWREEEE